MNGMKLWMGLALCALLPAVTSAATPDRGKKSRPYASSSTISRGHVQVREGRVRYGSPYGLQPVRSSQDSRSCGTPDLRPSYSHPGTWVPGHYELREQRVWIEGRIERVWVEPKFGLRFDDCGLEIRFPISKGYWKEIHHPGHFELRTERVWVPGQYVRSAVRAVHHR